MKKLLLLLLTVLLINIPNIMGQQFYKQQDLIGLRGNFHLSGNPSHFLHDSTVAKNVYLEKAKSQNTIGWVMLGGGAVMTLVGGIMFSNNFDVLGDGDDASADAGAILFLGGIACSLGSIPLFIVSAHNKRKAAVIGFENKRISYPQQDLFVVKTQPSITLKIGF